MLFTNHEYQSQLQRVAQISKKEFFCNSASLSSQALNGAGKTTAAPALLGQALQIDHFVNADAIAAGLSAFTPEKAVIQAGKTMLERMYYLANNNENFALGLPFLRKNGIIFEITDMRQV
ncbi:MAG: hypothetical protein ABI597_10650 [Gammaproteobacteria bacterium]